MTLRTAMVTIDCANLRRLTDFWGEALGYVVLHDFETFVMLGPAPAADGTAGVGVNIGLQVVPEPRVGKNRVHLDLGAGDRLAETERLVGLGARVLAEHHDEGFDFTWTVLADPEGNEFCIG